MSSILRPPLSSFPLSNERSASCTLPFIMCSANMRALSISPCLRPSGLQRNKVSCRQLPSASSACWWSDLTNDVVNENIYFYSTTIIGWQSLSLAKQSLRIPAMLVQCSIVQCSIVQCSIVQCSIVQCSIVQCSIVQCSIVQCSIVQCSIVQCSIVQCSIVQCSIVQCSIVQCSIVQCSIVQCSIVLLPGLYQCLYNEVHGQESLKAQDPRYSFLPRSSLERLPV